MVGSERVPCRTSLKTIKLSSVVNMTIEEDRNRVNKLHVGNNKVMDKWGHKGLTQNERMGTHKKK